MEVEDFKSNSHKSKEMRQAPEIKKVEKVTTGTVKTKKKSELRKFTDVFISEDIENVKSYVLVDVLIPAIKKAVVDIVSDGIQMIVYGNTGGRSDRSTASKVSYQRYYDRNRPERTSRYSQPRQLGGYSYDDIILETRGEAEDVLTRMDELVATYGMVSVADLCDLVGATGSYTDNKYGWTDIRSAHVIRNRDGYMIKLPKALPLD